MTTEGKIKLGYWANMMGAALSAVAVILLGIILNWVIGIENRVTAIESNRFTSADAMRVYELLSKKADREDVPPPEVTQAIMDLRAAVARIEARQIEHITGHNGG